jgi:hypothetical protein
MVPWLPWRCFEEAKKLRKSAAASAAVAAAV